MSTGLSPRFPLSFSDSGDFSNNQTVKEMVKQNFKNLLLTVPGERIMMPDFGVGIKKYLFEIKGAGIFENINGVSSKYISFINYLGNINYLGTKIDITVLYTGDYDKKDEMENIKYIKTKSI